jgi:hypothetical protein
VRSAAADFAIEVQNQAIFADSSHAIEPIQKDESPRIERPMSQINPFAGSILQSTQAQRQQAVERDRQVRRARDTAKNSALSGDELDHQVESSEELTPIHEEEKHERRFKRPSHPTDTPSEDEAPPEDKPRLDLTA